MQTSAISHPLFHSNQFHNVTMQLCMSYILSLTCLHVVQCNKISNFMPQSYPYIEQALYQY